MKSVLFFTSVFLSLLAGAQIKFTASASHSSVPLGSAFNVTFTLSGGSADQFTPPTFQNFIVRGQSSSSGSGGMTVIINGKVVQNDKGSSSWTYTLQPTKTGTFSIGPAKLKSGGKWYSSGSVSVKVTAGGNAIRSQNQTQSGKSAGQSSTQQKNASGGKEIFMKTIPSKSTVYEGEQFTVTYRVYSQYNISQIGTLKSPSTDGFWVEELLDPNAPVSPHIEVIDGKKYMVFDIRKASMIAQKSGTLTIPSMEREAIVEVPAQGGYDPYAIMDKMMKDPFGSFNMDPFAGFRSSIEKRSFSSNAIKIKVLPLPEEGKPENFNGAVGSFGINAAVDRKTCSTGDAVVLKITVNGSGNLPLIELKNPLIPESFEWFDPDITDNFTRSDAGIQGSRIFEYILQPALAGTFKLSPGSFSYFNPATEQYHTIELPEFDLNVKQGKGQNVISGKKINDDILHIHEGLPFLVYLPSQFAFSWLYWLLVLLIIAAFAGMLYYFRSRIRLKANVAEYRMRMAIRHAQRRLKTAKKWLDQGNQDEFYAELSKALWLYITDKFSIPFSELSLSNTRSILLNNNVPEDITDAFAAILDECEYTRFAPSSGRMSMNDLYSSASDLIVKVQTHALK